jgi:hypothetical protein
MWNALLAQAAEPAPPAPPAPPWEGVDPTLFIYIGAGVGGLVLLLLFLSLLFRKSKPAPVRRPSLREDLIDYPPAPPRPRAGLSFDGIPVRLRLVVVCPTGAAGDRIQTDDLAELLDEILYGLGSLLQTDKPRVKVWPPQLSATGFAPTFYREVQSPDPFGEKSHWILAAGPARAAGKPLLLGLALYADFPVKMGQMTLQGREWQQSLRVER